MADSFDAAAAEARLNRYPSIADLARRARRRIPHFAWEYLDSGTGREVALRRNREALDAVTFLPEGLRGPIEPDLAVRLFGRDYAAPFGVAPIGMTGLMWPDGETMLAEAAAAEAIPYCLSTVACEPLEKIGACAKGNGWFQLYTFADHWVNIDLLKRAADSGFSTLVVTTDVPMPSMRERQRRGGLQMPPKITPRFAYHIATRPAWALATARHGRPSFRGLEKYAQSGGGMGLAEFITSQRASGVFDWPALARLRDHWSGPMVIKGLLSPKDAEMALDHGFEGIVVSNHGGRQFDGAPASISALPAVVDAVGGRIKILFDSGVRSGLDVLRALALGADFVLVGRAFLYGLGALGPIGARHVAHILRTDLANNMCQLGAANLGDLRRLTRCLPTR